MLLLLLLLPVDRHRAAQAGTPRAPQQPRRTDAVTAEMLHRELRGAELVPIGTPDNGGLQRLPLP
ncbi:hypothetical protein PJ985_00620 [Streptomyces sp. ACA25]|uniref:hypothetical protein n=1 Tax=Streptomyces sp. ACA25 TaxID=3022596 RepID=UPI0023080812|nr:hypothetical protein [Streptomyces sp. ACA25]MDB1086086.1 hypothetical protein [Streptomyces sp. ACA25]